MPGNQLPSSMAKKGPRSPYLLFQPKSQQETLMAQQVEDPVPLTPVGQGTWQC